MRKYTGTKGHKIKRRGDKEANLTISELQDLAEQIRLIVTKGRGVTIEEYINAAKKVTVHELGYRNTKALQNEPKLEIYFPDEVIDILQKKGEGQPFFYFTKIDDDFMRKNRARGTAWLANYFYVDPSNISRRAKRCNIKIQPDRDIPVDYKFKKKIGNRSSKDIDKIIKKNAHFGSLWLSDFLNLNREAIAKRANRMGISIKRIK